MVKFMIFLALPGQGQNVVYEAQHKPPMFRPCSRLLHNLTREDQSKRNARRFSRFPKNLMSRGAEEETVAWRYFYRDVVPFAAMVTIKCVMVGSNTLFKAATLRGLSFYVSVFYTCAVATLTLLPLSLIFGRSRTLPSANSPVFFKIVLLALIGFVSLIAGCKRIEYSSPTLASAMSNTPAFTFTLAVIFRIMKILTNHKQENNLSNFTTQLGHHHVGR
ncbi:unnamed protein product [Arabis nemorensis]|uniref:WAT1-related protein n=1 Tax=Arabis nemorensis TaxID=586526 RepID=A0A565BU07_9BRAS|nr:unnamed protein product [Arabis nemorensis]